MNRGGLGAGPLALFASVNVVYDDQIATYNERHPLIAGLYQVKPRGDSVSEVA